eukprot:1923178-Amphidinium_carterae.1
MPRVHEAGLCPIQGQLLRALASLIQDPGDDISPWFAEGAPAGVTMPFDLGRTFAPSAPSDTVDPLSLQTDV